MAYCSGCGAQVADEAAFCPSCGVTQAPQPAHPDQLPNSQPPPVLTKHLDPPVVYAGFFRRWLAVIVDGLILGVPIAIVAVVIGLAGSAGNGDTKAAGELIQGTYYLLYLLSAPFYYALQESSSAQATVGKRLLGIKVTDLTGKRVSFGKAIGRWFAAALSYLTLYIGFLMAAFTTRKQALHDFAAGTLVVDRYAFTDQPQLQKQNLNGCLIAVVVGIFLIIPVTAILAAIALPAYNSYRVRAAEGACQAEAKAYMNSAVSAGMSERPINTPPNIACTSPTAAITSTDISKAATITFTPKPPGSASTTCDASTATCSMTSSL